MRISKDIPQYRTNQEYFKNVFTRRNNGIRLILMLEVLKVSMSSKTKLYDSFDLKQMRTLTATYLKEKPF